MRLMPVTHGEREGTMRNRLLSPHTQGGITRVVTVLRVLTRVLTVLRVLTRDEGIYREV